MLSAAIYSFDLFSSTKYSKKNLQQSNPSFLNSHERNNFNNRTSRNIF